MKLKRVKLLIYLNCSKIIRFKKLLDLTKRFLFLEPMKNGEKCAKSTMLAKKEKVKTEENLPDSADPDLATGLSFGSNTLFSKFNSKIMLLKKLKSSKILLQNNKKISPNKKRPQRNFCKMTD